MKEKGKRHIVVAVTNDLVTDQRVDRTCRTLVEAGYRVTLVGRRLPESPSLAERPYRMERMKLLFRRSAMFYAEYNLRLWLRLLRLRPDACWANDTDTLLASTLAARMLRCPLLFDAHELFPDVPELVDKPRVRSVWRWVEKRCLPRVTAAFTVCQSVAEEYKKRYGVEMTVVRNLQERGDRDYSNYSDYTDYSVLLYQGAVNVGRGVREAIDAMEWLPGCRLVVAGDGDLKEELEAYAAGLPWAERVKFLGRTEPQRLHALTCRADLGLCLLEDLGLNYRYALPNRVGDFIQAGVPLLATGFVEIARVVNEYGTGTLAETCPKEKTGEAYRAYVRRLASQIDDTLAYWRALPTEEREARFARARKELCWEEEKKRLLQKMRTIF